MANNIKNTRLSWEAIGIIVAIIISIAGVAFSFGIKSAQIGNLKNDVQDLKTMQTTIQVLDKNIVKIQTELSFFEPRLQKIDTKLETLNKNIDKLSRRGD